MSYFFSHPKSDLSKVDSICLGSGRFLRSVLVPALNAASIRTAIFQTRGSSFLEYSINTFTGNSDGDNEGISNFLSYEVDTVEYDGTVKTENVYYDAAGTLGSDAGKESAMKLLEEMERQVFYFYCNFRLNWVLLLIRSFLKSFVKIVFMLLGLVSLR